MKRLHSTRSGFRQLSGVLQQLLLWLPNLIVALAVLVIGGLAAGALSRVVRGATVQAGFGNPGTLATVAKIAVWGFAIVVAINQLGIATNLINTLLIGVVRAIALASGLAFDLGGRDRAAAVLDRAGRQAEAAGPQRRVRGGDHQSGDRQPRRDQTGGGYDGRQDRHDYRRRHGHRRRYDYLGRHDGRCRHDGRGRHHEIGDDGVISVDTTSQ